jgi:four helix bundle protein
VPIQSYHDLTVWRQAVELAVSSHRVAQHMPPVERFGLANQIRRAAVSVPANIAEGHARLHTAEYVNHLSIARGSLYELETHLVLAQRFGYLDETTLRAMLESSNEVGRLLNGLVRALRRSTAPGP